MIQNLKLNKGTLFQFQMVRSIESSMSRMKFWNLLQFLMVKGILKINQQLALYKGIREDATSDTVIDKVLAHVLADKLMKKVVVVDATADERGESVQVGEKRGAGGVVRVAEGC